MSESEDSLDPQEEAALSVEDLDRLLQRALATNDREVYLLVKQYQALKQVAGELLERTESTLRGAQSQQDHVTQLARYLLLADRGGTA